MYSGTFNTTIHKPDSASSFYLVGHSYGGIAITNAAYNIPNVKGLVYVAAFAPQEGQSLGDFVDHNSINFVILDEVYFTKIRYDDR